MGADAVPVPTREVAGRTGVPLGHRGLSLGCPGPFLLHPTRSHTHKHTSSRAGQPDRLPGQCLERFLGSCSSQEALEGPAQPLLAAMACLPLPARALLPAPSPRTQHPVVLGPSPTSGPVT